VTDLLDAVVALLVAGTVNVVIVARLGSKGSDVDGRFLARVYLATLLVRVGLAVLLNLFSSDSVFAATFWGDSLTYDAGGQVIARSWAGEAANTAAYQFLSGYGFMYFVGAVYYVFGRNQLLVQLLNATIGALTVLVIYAIARELFGREVARKAALFMAFFPQMLFWSAAMYKDPAVLLCIALCMYAVVCLRERFSLGHLVVFAVAAIALLTLRFYIFYFVAAATVGSFVFGRGGSLAQRLPAYGLLILVLVAGVGFVVPAETLETQRAYMSLNQMQVTRADQAMWGSSAYGTDYDVSTPAGALVALPIGLVYLLFAPFPWSISGARQLLVLPETLVWYSLMPAFVRGVVHAIRRRLGATLPILAFALTLTCAYALTQGNVGTAYRQRTQVSMFFFIFMAVGLVERRHRREASLEMGPLAMVSPLPAAVPAAAPVAEIADYDLVYPGVVEIEDYDLVYPDDGKRRDS
jgi:4-amino-4-deoxy-L-arabinose transferase-like glycosyltransferase